MEFKEGLGGEVTTRWKFLDLQDGKIRSRSGDKTWTIGKWSRARGEIEPCSNGFHCSPTIREAFGYVPGSVLAEVEVRGTSADHGDKSAHRDMRILRAWKFTKEDSVALAIFAAEQVVEIYEERYPGDLRPRKAIEAAKAYLENPTDATDAADAAYAAADAAAYTARAAARAAAEAAAEAAYAADAEFKQKIEAWFQDRIATLEEEK